MRQVRMANAPSVHGAGCQLDESTLSGVTELPVVHP